ncbi:DUF4883 family protein [Clostridium thermarum]|uniref:DUF4883 family protein n=1 Tax=Clostridium thermarum TaxID=1716543 RepID=UPI0011220125|nr:DUF4883 family protein [Clostridium thermarum]
MKKVLSLILLLSALLNLSACSSGALKYSFKGNKPNAFYYTDQLIKEIKAHGITNVLVLETNLNKELNLKDDDKKILISFLNSIKTSNFLTKAPDLPKKPEFKFYITIDDEKFVMNVYNEKYIGIHPWDGAYSMDYIDMSDVKRLYNLHVLCKYLYKN